MSYKVEFLSQALKEWESLDKSIKNQFLKKLKDRIKNPHIDSARLSGKKNRYKIKLNSIGYRLVYEVIDKELVVIVIAIGKRENSKVYKSANLRRIN